TGNDPIPRWDTKRRSSTNRILNHQSLSIKTKQVQDVQEAKYRREPIKEEVRIAVWRRDEGQCVMCASKERLEYDHIIPFSKGGSNTVRNIQLLCERCNREKSDKI
ncbi:MAG: HNH endonuclease, partial [Candidatus Latescibacterota bacterium]